MPPQAAPLATEIACLIRRLKAHAGLSVGELAGIGTSATVSSGGGGSEALADFATVLFGETLRPEDVVGESLVSPSAEGTQWTPPFPDLSETDLTQFNPEDDAQVVALAEKLTCRGCLGNGTIADRIRPALDGNTVVQALEGAFSAPASVMEATVLSFQLGPFVESLGLERGHQSLVLPQGVHPDGQHRPKGFRSLAHKKAETRCVPSVAAIEARNMWAKVARIWPTKRRAAQPGCCAIARTVSILKNTPHSLHGPAECRASRCSRERLEEHGEPATPG